MLSPQTFTTTEDDLVAGNRLHAKQLWNRRAVLRGWLLYAAVMSLVLFTICDDVLLGLYWVPLVATVWMATGWLISQLTFGRAARRDFREMGAFLRPTVVAWDEGSVQSSSDRGKSRDDWSNFYSWAADDRSVLLYQSANLYIMLPVRDLGNAAKVNIVSALEKAGVAQRSTL